VRYGLYLRSWLLPALIIGAWPGSAAAGQAAPEQASVLILLPGQPGLPAATAIASGIRSVLLTEFAFRISIEMEHVDITRFASPEVEERRLRTIYGAKYEHQRFDVIVAALPEPFRFVLHARDELWPGTPVVVCGVDERTVRNLKPAPGFAVLTIRLDTEGTLRAAWALLPDTRHVALVGGASPSEQLYHDLVRQAVSAVGGLDVIDLTKLPIADVLSRVARLPEHTVVVQSSYQVDGAGHRFNGIDLVPHVSKAANQPVFTPMDLALGRGVVGGSIVDFEDVGRDAGRMVARLIQGEAPPPSPVPSFASPVRRFDGRQLARWHLDERRLPEDSQIIFRRPTLWEQYRWHVVSAVGLIGLQAALIATLLVQRRRRRETQANLAERLRFEALVSEVIAACASAPLEQLDERIRDGLRRVVIFLGVDRGSLWQRAAGSTVLSLTHFWQRQDQPIPPMIADLESFPHFRDRTDTGQVTCWSNLDELPAHASAERAGLRAAGVRSFAAIPLFDGDRPAGFLVFLGLHAEHRWPAPVVQQLQALAEPFSTALIRARSAAAVESSVATAGAVLAALPGETAIIDSAGTIVQANDAWATAARSGTAASFALKVGANYLDACRNAVDMPPDTGRRVHASLASVLRGERSEFTLEYPTSRRGEDRWFELRVRRLARLGGGAAVMHFDVTARRQAEAAAHRDLNQIAHLDRVAGMGQLASSLAHELNQPLAAVLLNAQTASRLLAAPQPDVEELRACVADIINDDQRAGEVIRRMRRLLRKSDVVRVPLDLNGLVADTIALVENEALLQAVTIEFAPAPALPVVYGDVVQIQQVVLNLLTNGITAAANGGAAARKVAVWTSAATLPSVEIGVHDSGNGIADTDLDRIFEPFFTTKVGGLGMGLAITRTIVEAHGGRLLAENDQAGGATFRVQLNPERPRTA
jgi:signal transduction histidine kinase/GAF domain-containing protein